MTKQTKNIFFMIISIVGLIITTYFVDIECKGWQIINPLCQFGNIFILMLKMILYLVFFMFFVYALMNIFELKKQVKNVVLFLFFGIITLILWIIPDPLPLIDELIASGIDLFYLYKIIKGEKK